MSNAIVAYFDFETYNLTDYKFGEEPLEKWDKLAKSNKPVAVYAAGLLVEDKAYTWFGVDAIDNFWKKIIEIGRNKSIILIAHNCGYDFAFINEYLHTNGWSKIKSFKAAQTDDDRAWLWADINVDGIDITFKDTWIWDKTCSLKCYTDILELDNENAKGKLLDYEKWNLFEKDNRIFFYDKDGKLKELDYELEKEYLLKDIKILPKVKGYIYDTKKKLLGCDFIPNEVDWIYSFSEINSKLTKASFAKSCFEIYLQEHFYQTYKVPISEEFYRLQNKSYIGGFTAGNKFITELDLDEAKITTYDVNSLYPSIMAGPLPIGEVTYSKPKESHCEWLEITGTYCEYKEKYAFLDCPIISTKFQDWLKRNKQDKDILLELPTFLILREYFDIINEFCDNDLKIVNIRYQKLSRKLAPAIIDAYNLRVLVKKTNKPLADSIKLFLNSGYGKFGEKVHHHLIQWNEQYRCWEKVKAKKAEFYTNLLTGLYVCTKGRIKLMKAIKTEIENGNTFLYSDTDSIKIVENNPVKLQVDSDKLGAWKFEGAYNVWRYPLKRKRYYCKNTFTGEEKITCGGFNKWILDDLSFEEKLIFFSANTNTLIKKGKKARYIGNVLEMAKDQVLINRYGLTKLFNIDISTTNELKNPDYIIEEINEKWIMRKNESR